MNRTYPPPKNPSPLYRHQLPEHVLEKQVLFVDLDAPETLLFEEVCRRLSAARELCIAIAHSAGPQFPRREDSMHAEPLASVLDIVIGDALGILQGKVP